MIDRVTIELSYLSARRRRQVVRQSTENLRFLKVSKIDGTCFKSYQFWLKIIILFCQSKFVTPAVLWRFKGRPAEQIRSSEALWPVHS